MGTMINEWLASEIAEIREVYPTGGTSACRESLTRHESSTVKMKAHTLGLRRTNFVWSAREDAEIRRVIIGRKGKFADAFGNLDYCRSRQRSYEAVRQRAMILTHRARNSRGPKIQL